MLTTTQTASRHIPPPSPSPSAAAAATQAFAKSQNPNGALSAAAAAAALRTHPPPPTSVGNATSKRLQRRDSNGSSASGAGSQRPDTLQRRGSAGSMTERTFRSPSPHRGSPVVQVARDAPPVPAVPTDVAELERTSSSHRRTASMEPPLRLYSPPPKTPRGRGVSLDRIPYSPPLSPASAGGSKLSKVLELEREESQRSREESQRTRGESQRSSVNFSRPMSPQATSPPVQSQSQQPKSAGYFTGPLVSDQKPRQTLASLKPKGGDPPPPADVSFAPPALYKSADAPIEKKKKRRVSAGSHFAAGTTKLTGTAVESLGHRGEDGTERDSTNTNISKYAAHTEHDGLHNSGDSGSETSSLSGRDKGVAWTTRPGGLLSKQPSVVHERPEAEEQLEKATSADTGKKTDPSYPKSSLDSSRYAVLPPTTAASVSQTDKKQSQNASPVHVNGNTRTPFLEADNERHSVSPSRSAHFSVVPVDDTNGFKHSPPGRAVSPFKSALKHSPSSSLRTTSPEAHFGANHSRTGSSVQEETHRPKKTARVSFDDTPVTVSTGLEASKYAVPDKARRMSDDDLEEVMKPRPALPSFGSVRGRKDLEETRNLPRSSGRRTPSPLADSQSTLIGVDRSNDHAVGGILAQDFATKQQTGAMSNVPLPPEVTSVEGTGYDTDSDSTFTMDSTVAQPARPTVNDSPPPPVEAPPPNASHLPQSDKNEEIPSFTLIPPTPLAEEVVEFNIPGAFPDEDETDVVSKNGDYIGPSGTAFPASKKDGNANRPTGDAPPPVTGPHRLMAPLDDDESSDSDTSSVYSDAAEDPTEYGGFASLNAILESPLPPAQAESGLSIKTERELKSDDTNKAPPSPTAAQWDTTTAYWRSLSEKRKEELEQRAQEDEKVFNREHDITTTSEPARPETPPVQAQNKRSSQQATAAPQPVASANPHQPNKPRQSAMKRTLRASPNVEQPDLEHSTHMRSSLRSGGTMPTTMRGSPVGRGQSPGLGASRWSSPPAPREPKGALQKKRVPMAPVTSNAPAQVSSKAKNPTMASTLRRTGSADSASSFKRQRSTPANADGRVTMRRSMRDASPQGGLNSSKFSVRSLSPTGSNANYHMRSSLRGSIDSSAPTLRSPEKKSRFKSPTRFGRSKKSAQAAAQAVPSPPKYKSRFANDSDDDDDDDVPRTAFVSRFVDSDDDLDSPTSPHIPSGLAPVRGIPRKAGDDRDSTDLEDESGDERLPIPAVPSAKDIERAHMTSQTNGLTQGAALANGSLRESADGLAASKYAPRPDIKKRRLSFLGLGKTRASSVPVTSSRPGTSDSTTRPPKLQRRVTPSRLPQVAETSWPLPPAVRGEADDDRPNNSESMPQPKSVAPRPDVGKRRSTADELGGYSRTVSFSADPIYSSKTGKKKKFPMLRKMFGLND
jgi:serine/arginine repetitive matrix protein 2